MVALSTVCVGVGRLNHGRNVGDVVRQEGLGRRVALAVLREVSGARKLRLLREDAADSHESGAERTSGGLDEQEGRRGGAGYMCTLEPTVTDTVLRHSHCPFRGLLPTQRGGGYVCVFRFLRFVCLAGCLRGWGFMVRTGCVGDLDGWDVMLCLVCVRRFVCMCVCSAF